MLAFGCWWVMAGKVVKIVIKVWTFLVKCVIIGVSKKLIERKIMKKVMLKVVAAVLMVVGISSVAIMEPAHAVICSNGTTEASIEECPEWKDKGGVSDNNDMMGTLNTVLNVVVGLVGFVSVAVIVLGGISFATSQGDTARTTKAKNTILYGVVGLVVVLLAFAIVNFVLNSVFAE